MYNTFCSRGILVTVTLEAELGHGGRRQFDSGGIPFSCDFVAGSTAHRHGRVDRLVLRLLLVTLETLGGIEVRLQGYWVFPGTQTHHSDKHHEWKP
jgi:hypothetical protein